MSQETNMTIRLGIELRQNFLRAAKTNNRPGAQVLRELMRDYIAETDRNNPPAANLPTATAEGPANVAIQE